MPLCPPGARCRRSADRRGGDRAPAPTLAICRGMQLLNVVCGGTLVPDLPGHDWEDDDRRHAVAVEPDSVLARDILCAVSGDVSSSHHQAVDRPGAGLRIVATSPDGIAEAIE